MARRMGRQKNLLRCTRNLTIKNAARTPRGTLMGLIWKRDQDDDRSTREVFCTVEEEVARKLTGRCTFMPPHPPAPRSASRQGGEAA